MKAERLVPSPSGRGLGRGPAVGEGAFCKVSSMRAPALVPPLPEGEEEANRVTHVPPGSTSRGGPHPAACAPPPCSPPSLHSRHTASALTNLRISPRSASAPPPARANSRSASPLPRVVWIH